jgi:hypothetical protein
VSFKLFIYYCALGGGWAAFLAWFVVQFTGMRQIASPYAKSTMIAGILGLCIATVIGFLDAYLNSVGFQRVLRVALCLIIGFVGGMLGGFIGEGLHLKLGLPLFFGWMLAGAVIGASIGIFDLMRALMTDNSMRVPIRKTLNGVFGGLLGGLIGGAPFGVLMENPKLPTSNLAIGLVLLGICVGLLIGLAQVILKEAWLKIERGFRAGREVMLTKDETIIGRAEACDVGIFGDMDVEKKHARIVFDGDRYVVHDNNSARGTYVNDRRVNNPQELVTGDLIRVGNCYLRFGERQKRS